MSGQGSGFETSQSSVGTSLLWERACPAITGEAGAMHRSVLFAGKPAPTKNSGAG